MKYRYQILTIILLLLIFGFSNSIKNDLLINNIEGNTISLSFHFSNDDLENQSSQYIAKNQFGYPAFNYILSIPDNNNLNDLAYEILSYDSIENTFNNKNYFMEGLKDNESFQINNNPVYISNELIKNNQKYISLTIEPMQSKNAQLIVREEIQIELVFSNNIQNIKILTPNETASLLTRDTNSEEIPVLLIIAPDGDNIYNLMTPLINWKKLKGYKVLYHSLSETGYTNNEIKTFIQNIYDNGEYPPDYISIVGDADGTYAVPTFNENISIYNGETDHPYTLLEGDDNISDVSIGRLSIRSLSDLATIINKIITYEQYPYIAESDWFEKGLCVGDPSISGVSTVITNQIIAEMMIEYNYEEIIEVYQHPFVNQIEDAINAGVSFYNYRGFAGSSGWQKDGADNLNNGYMLPVVSVITCDTGSFLTDEESISENFLRTGSISIPKGGIAAIGMSTQGTHTMFNNCLDYSLYHALFVEKIEHIGDAINYAKNNLLLNYPNNPNDYVDMFSHWINLMGDPTLSVWTGTPDLLEINFQENIPFGQNYLDIEAMANSQFLENVIITITDSNFDLIAKGATNQDGALLLNWEIDSAPLGIYNIVATKNNHIPFRSEIAIQEMENSINIVDFEIIDQNSDSEINPDDTININFKIKNYGINNLANLAGEVILEDESINTNSPNFTITETITPNQHSALISIESSIIGNMFSKDVSGEIVITHEDTIWRFPFSFLINSSEVYLFDLYTSTGESFLTANSNNEVYLTFKNQGLLPSMPLELNIYLENNFLQLENETINIPEIQPGALYTIENPIYILTAHEAYPGLQVPATLSYLLNGEMVGENLFTLNVGTISFSDPLGPDEYGYYIFDFNDISYNSVPIYDWIEIDPYSSGSGTILIDLQDNGNNQDDVTFINLPFNFQFYGNNYDQISISTNGWIKPGLTNQSSFRNWRLPGAGGPSPMIAAFWDDLETNSGRICVDYDSINNWYIIEWSSVNNGFDDSEETFQIIIYDTMYYPTITGDNIIKIQYKEFNNVNSGHYDIYNQWHGNYASIGIENASANIGLEYTWNNEYSESASELDNESAILITTNPPEYLYPPIMVIHSFGDYHYQLLDNEIIEDYIEIENAGEANLYFQVNKDCGEPEGLSTPDNFGNAWIDSNHDNGPDFEWIEISEYGTPLVFINNDTGVDNIPIGFDFPFYDNQYTELLINPNGWIGFGNDNYNYVNVPLPSDMAPTNSIMGLWDDLNPANQANHTGEGNVYYYSNNNQFIITYEDVRRYQVDDSDYGLYTFQIILDANGEIIFNYLGIEGINNSATIGIQNQDSSGYLLMNFNSILSENYSMSISQLDNWLTYSIESNVLQSNEQQQIEIQIDAEKAEDIYNECELIIESNATNLPDIIIPFTLEIIQDSTGSGDVNLDGELDVLDIVAIVQLIIENTNNEELILITDVNLDGELNVLDIVLIINLILNQ